MAPDLQDSVWATVPDNPLADADRSLLRLPSSSQNSRKVVRTLPTTVEEESNTTLPVNQIITLLHQRPEVAVDLKHLLAEFWLKQGIAAQEDSITDELLFSNLASNRALRRAASLWLRARGYIPDDDFPDESNIQIDDTEPLSAQQQQASLARQPGTPQMPQRDLALESAIDLPEGSELVTQDPSLAPTRMSGLPILDSSGYPTREQTLNAPLQHALKPSSAKQAALEAEQPELLLRRPAPYNLESLRDLYTQVPEQTADLKPFGTDLFVPRGTGSREIPIDLPIGPDYILGPGDAVMISLWGGVTQSFTRPVMSGGSIVLPEAGPVQVAGLTLEHAEALIQNTLAGQFHNERVLVSIARLHTVRIYVVGDVLRPGAYDLSAVSTPLNALYAAGGPTRTGSLRHVRHTRGHALLRELDLYDFLRNGLRTDTDRLQAGDTIVVPPIGATAEISGMVKRPAIYEFDPPTTLAQILAEAGGLRAEAAVAHIRVERIEVDGHRSTTEIELPNEATSVAAQERMAAFTIQDGDRIVVAPVLPYSEKVIYTSGHFARPGRAPYREGMTLSEALHSFQDLLPEPAPSGEIIRLVAPDLHPEAIAFQVADVIGGRSPAIPLRPFDTILVRGRYENDAPRVTMRGEVLKPGVYALTDGMTAAQLVRLAGGFKRSALVTDADLASYEVRDGTHVISRRRTVRIGDAVLRPNSPEDVPLLPGDVLTVHQISGWDDIGSSITLTGEVTYPGTYGLQEGETLSSVIRRAGGLRETAYPEGAVMVRQQVKQLEVKSRTELIRQIETTSAGARLGAGEGDQNGTLQLLVQQQNQVLERLRTEPIVGRLVITISSDISAWQNTPADIQLRAGDVVQIPKRPGFVLVTGQAYNTSAISFVPGRDAGWYLRHAGGATDMANRKEVFVIRANGLVVGRRSGEWYQSVLSTRMNPGDVVVVPQKIVGGSAIWKNTLATAQIVSSIAFTAALALR